MKDNSTGQQLSTKMTIEVDARTAGKIIWFAMKWDKSPGEVVDSIMRNFVKHLKEGKKPC